MAEVELRPTEASKAGRALHNQDLTPVAHEKPRITYGLYSGGASLETKAAALALVKYSTARQ